MLLTMTQESVYDRLYRQATAASASKAVSPRHSSSVSGRRAHATLSPRVATATPKASLTSPRKRSTKSSDSKAVHSSSALALGDQQDTANLSTPASAPEIESKEYSGPWKLTYTSKYDKKNPKAVLPLNPHTLKISSQFASYEHGQMNEQRLAHDLIEALFYRDFMDGKRWDIDPAYATLESSGDGVIIYKAEKEATWDWKDIYAVASAKGMICFYADRQEIRVENYSYYVAG